MLCLPSNAILLDIETTGLKRETERIISIGIIYPAQDDTPAFKHWFLEPEQTTDNQGTGKTKEIKHTGETDKTKEINPTGESEKVLLEDFLRFITNTEYIYSYYGKSFDYPFLLSRMEHFNLDTSPFLKLKLIDMKDCLKHFSNNRQELENLLNFKRESTVSGKEVIKLYRTYEASKASVYKELILKHQSDELNSLISFYEVYHLLMHIDELTCLSQQLLTNELKLSFKAKGAFKHSFSGEAFGWQFRFTEGEPFLSLCLPLVTASLKQYLEPAKDYFYIESQGQLMHKSLAQFVPAALKRKASKEECTIKKASLYFKIHTSYKVTCPIWYDDSKNMYIEAENFSLELLKVQLFSLFFKRSSS